MSNNIELLSQYDNFTIGTNSNLSEILANVVKVGTDTSNVTISIPQDISSSYNLILPVRQGASGESLVYGADGQLKWHDTTVLKQVVPVYGSTLTGNLISTTGTHDSPTYLDAYTANITPMADNSKIFVQFKVNYHASLSASNQISFFIKKTYDGNETIFTESLFGPYNAAGGFTGQYISNLVDEALTSSSISYQLGYQINGTVDLSDTLGILGYDNSHNNTIVLQEFEGSGSNATSVWNKGADSNGLYYSDGTVHIGSSKDALGSQNTVGVALELSGNLVGTNAYFSGQVIADTINAREGYFSANTLYINNKPVLNEDAAGNRTVNTDVIISDASNGLNIKAIGDNGNIILDPSGTGTIQLKGDVQLSEGNLTAETFIGDLSGNVNAVTMAATTTTTNNLSLDGTLTTSNSSRVVGNLIPSANITYDLGSSTHMWRDIYVGPGSLYVNNKKVIEDNSDTINITTDEGQNLKIKTSGNGGQLQIQSEVGGIAMSKSGNTGDITITTTSGGDINMNAYDNVQITAGDDLQLTSTSGTIQLKSAVNITNGMTVSNPTGDDIKIDDNLQITGQVKTNEIIEYTTNSGVTIENVLIKDGNVNGNLVGNVTGHVTGTVSSLSNHTTDNLTQGSTNKYFSNSLVDSHLEGGTGVTYSNGSISIGQSVGTSDNVQFNNVTVDGTLNSDDITGSNVTVSNDLVVSGNLRVNGTQTIVNSTTLDIGDNKIVVNADGGSTPNAGIIANVNGVEHEFVYTSSNNAWGTTGDLNIGGNVTATTFIGDGSQLTGISAGGSLVEANGGFKSLTTDTNVGANGIAIGYQSGNSNQGSKSIAIGYQSGKTNQGGSSIAIGGAGINNQGSQCVAIGFQCGNNYQGQHSIAIGPNSQRTIQNQENVVSIGFGSAELSAKTGSVSVGTYAGQKGGQYSLNLGYYANKQGNHNNTITLNATGLAVNSTQSDSFFVKPIRNIEGNVGALQYNDSTGEVSYSENLSLTGNVTATTFIGDGSQLTGISTGANLTNHSDASFGNVDISGTLEVQDDASFNSNVDISGTLEVQGNATFSNVDISGSMGIGCVPSNNRLHIKQSSDGSNNNPGNAIRIEQSDSTAFWQIGLDEELEPELVFRFNGGDNGGYLSSAYDRGQLDFTGQHRCIINKNFNVLLNIGLIVSTNNNFFNLNNTINPNINESLPICNLSNINNDKKVFGVISSKEDESSVRKYSSGNFVSTYSKTNINEQRLYINSLGEGAIWVCNKNGPLENGDYITSSSVTGYGMKQDDDLLHNYTVAKITCDCDFDLTKIVKQKVNTFIDGSNEQNLVYDSNGDVELINDLDASGNIQMVYKYDTRFLDSSGNIVKEGSHDYIACFVGCTYHCG